MASSSSIFGYGFPNALFSYLVLPFASLRVFTANLPVGSGDYENGVCEITDDPLDHAAMVGLIVRSSRPLPAVPGYQRSDRSRGLAVSMVRHG